MDASCFLTESRFRFLLKLLAEEELDPHTIIISTDLYEAFREYLSRESLPDGALSQFLDIADNWELGRFSTVRKWNVSSEFQTMLKLLFKRTVVPARELVGISENPVDIRGLEQELGRAWRTLHEELSAANKAKTFLVGLTRRLSHLLKRAKIYLIEFPLAKKKAFMQKHKFFGAVLFYLVLEISKDSLSNEQVQKSLSDAINYASPIVRILLDGITYPHWHSK